MTLKKITIICKYCAKQKDVWPNSNPQYCCYQCSADDKYNNFITEWKAGTINGGYPNHKTGVHKRLVKYFKANVHNCMECGIGKVWNGKLLVFEIDHINGDRENNYYSNLRYLCPNCHSQTDTFRAKNIKKYGPLV